MSDKNIIAIGRSRYLFDGIKFLVSKGFIFKAIVTDEAYDEYDVKATDFEILAKEINAVFIKTSNVNNEELINIIESNNIKTAISANWKYVISEKFRSLFECGILNFHLGNLPDYKGNATVNWTIINGEKFIYGNIHKMENELDSGNIIARKKIEINEDTYIDEILKQAEIDVPFLYYDALMKINNDSFYFELKGTSDGLRCYPRLPEDSQIDWSKSVEDIHKLIRASSHPYSGAFTFLNDKKIIIWKARIVFDNNFLAIPGHIVEINNINNTILVACSNGLLEINSSDIVGEIKSSQVEIKSIRSRFKYKV